MGMFSTLMCTFVIALAVFITYPAPDLPQKVIEWKNTGKHFKFKEFNIFYHDDKGTGPASDVVVVFHGYPTSSYDFIKVWDSLLERYGRVIAPDFLGFGLSDKPSSHNYTVMGMADVVTSLLVDLEVGSFHVLAHDLGDTVAQEIVARSNEGTFEPKLTIKSVCLLNGGILPEHHQPRLTQKLLVNQYTAPIVMRLMNFHTFRRAVGECFGPSTQPTEEEFMEHWALTRYNDGHLVHHGLIQYIAERFANRDRWVSALTETKLPLHLIYGPSDPVNPPATFLASFKKLIPNSGVTELRSDISHYPHLEHPRGVLEGYFNFLDALQKKDEKQEELKMEKNKKPDE